MLASATRRIASGPTNPNYAPSLSSVQACNHRSLEVVATYGRQCGASAFVARSSLVCLTIVAVGRWQRKCCRKHGVGSAQPSQHGLSHIALGRRRASLAVCASLRAYEEDDEEEDGLDFSVAPWSDTVAAKPIFVVSDCTGTGAQLLVRSAWAQFGSSDEANLHTRSQVQTPEQVLMVVDEIASCACEANKTKEDVRGLLVYTLASKELSSYLERECKKRGIECINALEPALVTMEESFARVRQEHHQMRPAQGIQSTSEVLHPAVFVVSCGHGNCTFHLICAALKQFPQCDLKEVTVCPLVNTLEEMKLIVQKAAEANAIIVFTFASPGMSRFARRQCVLSGVHYTDLFQPLLVTMEIFLRHPFLGVPGGLDLKSLAEAELRWERRAIV